MAQPICGFLFGAIIAVCTNTHGADQTFAPDIRVKGEPESALSRLSSPQPAALQHSTKPPIGFLHAWETGSRAKAGIGRWITFYNQHRPHTAHGGQPPAVVYFNNIETEQQRKAVA